VFSIAILSFVGSRFGNPTCDRGDVRATMISGVSMQKR
jgi:hypothetical protein